MSIDITVPQLPESVADATVASWSRKAGESIQRDEVLVELETDKVVLEVPAPVAGVVEEILHEEGATVTADTVLGRITEGASAAPTKESEATAAADEAAEKTAASDATQASTAETERSDAQAGPAARKLMAEHGIEPDSIAGSGKNGRILKEDVQRHLAAADDSESSTPREETSTSTSAAPASASTATASAPATGERPEERVAMTRLRARIAERLVQASQETAMLTTFNEANMQPIMDLRARYKDTFQQTHGIKLGFMGLFVKAASEALRRFPDINASIDGHELVYHGYCDIGIAVSSERGLVVPIVRDAETLAIADIERRIRDFGERAPAGRISLDEMTGGTFSITNGGVFGSLLSTPILNPPQSAILGMHKIQERPVAENGAVVIRPMMYLALSYDHRIVDGKDSVQFLVALKELLEDPARMLLGL